MVYSFSGLGILPVLDAAAGPFLLHSLITKTVERQPAALARAALPVFGPVFRFWLLSVPGTLPAA
ncbi:MAG: hypothetical protein OSJ58_03375 [Dysosmobacter sp.]|nr:hypothetical protein [Dysosmobacter sp.]